MPGSVRPTTIPAQIRGNLRQFADNKTPSSACNPAFLANLERSREKSTQVPLHEPFTHKTKLFQSSQIKPNQVILQPICPPRRHANVVP
jgi:hypothetical protein